MALELHHILAGETVGGRHMHGQGLVQKAALGRDDVAQMEMMA